MVSNRMSKNALLFMAVGYLYLPLLLFAIGWLKIYLSIVLIPVSVAGLYFALKKTVSENKDAKISSNYIEMLVMFFVFVLFFVLNGHGDLFIQDFDWHKHHAIFYDLMNYRWPVIYENNAMLTYYLGQYLVPAFIAKVCGKSVAVLRVAVPLWNALGLLIVYLLTADFLSLKKVSQRSVIAFFMMFWSGLTIFGKYLYIYIGHNNYDYPVKWIDFERVMIHFASNFDALGGAFQHVIVPWIAVILFLTYKDKFEMYLLLALPMFFSSTFGFVYFIPILFVYCVFYMIHEKNAVPALKCLFSAGNLLLIPLTAVVVLYLSGNVLSDKPDVVGTGIIDMSKNVDFYLVFIFVEFMIYALILLWDNRKNVFYYIVVAELLIIPFISMGLANDLCSRGSIPARFILMLLCIKKLFTKNKMIVGKMLIVISLLVALITPCLEIKAKVEATNSSNKYLIADAYKSFEGFAGDVEKAQRVDNAYNYFTLEYSDSFFSKIAR